MLALPKLALRVLRRLGRVKGLENPALLVENGLDELLFLIDLPGRQSGRQAFEGARGFKDHFDFSSRFFGPHQLETEIGGLLAWVESLAPKMVCEIGTAMGGTTYLLGQSLPTVTHVIGIDLFVRRKRRLRHFMRSNQQLELVDGSSYAPETAERVKRHLAGTKLDLLFIDGDHSYDGVVKDFSLYRHFVRDGGVIVFHDIVQDYTTRYGRNTPRYTGGVPRFWEQLKPLYSTKEFVESPDQDGFGIGALLYDGSISPPKLV